MIFFPPGCIHYDTMLEINISTHTLVQRMQVANNNFAQTRRGHQKQQRGGATTWLRGRGGVDLLEVLLMYSW